MEFLSYKLLSNEFLMSSTQCVGAISQPKIASVAITIKKSLSIVASSLSSIANENRPLVTWSQRWPTIFIPISSAWNRPTCSIPIIRTSFRRSDQSRRLLDVTINSIFLGFSQTNLLLQTWGIRDIPKTCLARLLDLGFFIHLDNQQKVNFDLPACLLLQKIANLHKAIPAFHFHKAWLCSLSLMRSVCDVKCQYKESPLVCALVKVLLSEQTLESVNTVHWAGSKGVKQWKSNWCKNYETILGC